MFSVHNPDDDDNDNDVYCTTDEVDNFAIVYCNRGQGGGNFGFLVLVLVMSGFILHC